MTGTRKAGQVEQGEEDHTLAGVKLCGREDIPKQEDEKETETKAHENVNLG